MAEKVRICQAQGNLQEAARLLSGINWQTPSGAAFGAKINQLTFERKYGEAVRLLQAQLAQVHLTSDLKALSQLTLARTQRLASDTAGAKFTAEQARNTFESLCREQPENPVFAGL